MIDTNYRNKIATPTVLASQFEEKKEWRKRKVSHRAGKRRRLRNSEKKLTNPGFGCPWTGDSKYYYVEFQDKEGDIIELHWLKVRKITDSTERAFIKRIASDVNNAEDFLATFYLQTTMAEKGGPLWEKGATWAVIFPAKRLYDSKMRDPIAEISGAWEYALDIPLLGLMRSTLYVEEIVPGDQVSLENRRCLPGTEIKGGAISVSKE